ncbi:MAG: hypothetical protein RIC03_14750 [Cyclobacteriaceae bacterium]
MKNHLFAFIVFLNFNAYSQEQNILDSCFQGGAKNFYQLIGENLKYEDRPKVGLSILYWEINKGQIQNVSVLNSLGESTTKELKRVLQLTENNWTVKEEVVKCFLPIKFKIGGSDYFVDPYPQHYLKEVGVSGYGGFASSITSDEQLISKMNKFIEKGKYKSAIANLDIVIQRNPLNKQLRETRIYYYQELDLHEEACQEIAFLESYLELTSKYSCEEDL